MRRERKREKKQLAQNEPKHKFIIAFFMMKTVWFDSSSISTFCWNIQNKKFSRSFSRILFLMMKILQVNCIIFKTASTEKHASSKKCKNVSSVQMQFHIVLTSQKESFIHLFGIFFLLDFCNFIHFICPIRCLFISFHSVCILCYHFLEISVEIMFYYSFHIAIVCSIHLMSNSLNSIPFDIIAAVVAIQRHIYIKCSSTRLSPSLYLPFYLKHPFHCFHFGIVLFFMYK